jgi:hypothetical protein
VNKIVIVFLFFFGNLHGQFYASLKSGVQLSILYQVGSHQKGVGLRINAYCQSKFVQLNSAASLTYYYKSYGERKRFFENKNELGLVCFFGRENQFFDWQLSTMSHQTRHNWAISYSSIWYNDNSGTSQRSGAFGLQLKKISLILENDAFAGIATDRFRTGIFRVDYKDSLVKFGTGIYLWTGETNGVSAKTIPGFPLKKYKDISTLPYGKTSHGIWYGQLQFLVSNAQYIQLKLGLDSEEIRNSLQNRFLHDLPFLPRKYQNQTPHYPRLNKDGLPLFTTIDTRKSRLYFSVGLNEN